MKVPPAETFSQMPVVLRADSKAAAAANLNVHRLDGVLRSSTLSVKKKLGGVGGRAKGNESIRPTTIIEEGQPHHSTGSDTGNKRQERGDVVVEGGPGGDKKRESGFGEKMKVKICTTGGLLDRAKTMKWANMGSLKRAY